jgi:hypothetical protein
MPDLQPIMKTPIATITALLLVGAAGIASAAAADSFSVEPTSQLQELSVKYGGRRLMTYSFAPGRFKPYVKELATLDGDNLLRDSPFDHLHHHALMYAIRVNGLNFWEEVPGCGVEKVVRTEAPEVVPGTAGAPMIRLRQVLHWLAPQDAFQPDNPNLALLVEERTITLSVNESAREVALEWQSAFAVGGKTNVVTVAGANYYGLGMRFLQELDALADHVNAGGPPDLANGRQDTTAHAWGAVRFNRPGRPGTIVLAGHPDNPRGNSVFFTMRTPFAYLSATQALDREAITYRTGDRFQLRFLVALYPAVKDAAALDARVKAWREEKR